MVTFRRLLSCCHQGLLSIGAGGALNRIWNVVTVSPLPGGLGMVTYAVGYSVHASGTFGTLETICPGRFGGVFGGNFNVETHAALALFCWLPPHADRTLMPTIPRAPWSRARRPISLDSSFDCTCKHPLCEVPLEEWIHDQNWKGGEYHDRHLHSRGRRQWLSDLLSPGEHLALQNVQPQDQRDGPHRRVVDVEQRVEVIRPQRYSIEEGDYRQDRFRERQHNQPENLERIRAIHHGRIGQVGGYVHEKLPHDDQVEGADQPWHDQRLVRVQHAEKAYEEIVGNNPGVEQQGPENQDQHEPRSRYVAGAGQAICQRGRHHHTREGADHRHTNTY